VRFGIFYEHQNPRPWREDRSEHRLLKDALEQVELADRVGFDCVWGPLASRRERLAGHHLHSGRFHVEGDVSLATRVPEMFGAPPRF
jgi:hypothetical protein